LPAWRASTPCDLGRQRGCSIQSTFCCSERTSGPPIPRGRNRAECAPGRQPSSRIARGCALHAGLPAPIPLHEGWPLVPTRRGLAPMRASALSSRSTITRWCRPASSRPRDEQDPGWTSGCDAAAGSDRSDAVVAVPWHWGRSPSCASDRRPYTRRTAKPPSPRARSESSAHHARCAKAIEVRGARHSSKPQQFQYAVGG